MPPVFSIQSLVVFCLLARQTLADCQSTGTDFVNGGGPYCINTTSTDYFSFGTEFQGCQPSDTQGDVIPILVDPNNNDYYCSGIATQPDDTEMRSTCNVPGNEVRKNQMISGTWIVVIEGLTFAWMRSFLINAAPPVTVTSTPTVSFQVTSTPTSTATTTNTVILTSTLPPATVTAPSSTSTKTSTIYPSAVTTTITSLLTLSQISLVFSQTTKTVTLTTLCLTKLGPWDPICTIHPTKARFAAATGVKARSVETTLPSKLRPRNRFQKDRAWAEGVRREAEARGLMARSADLCTTTVIASSNLPSTTLTVTAPVTTVVLTSYVSVTSTLTPTPVTVFSGVAKTTITITKPTPTSTRIIGGITNTVVKSTVWATLTVITQVPPPGVACKPRGHGPPCHGADCGSWEFY